ncbi:MAG: hypothetical protein MUC72_10650 [Acidobacteria bacterium]|jgi:hypothetical protein|nr:hypothetical protein [Acidobacteriota bacterium]
MGKKLVRIYQLVEEMGGLPGRMKLAQTTGITQQQAREMKDWAETVKRFKKAAAESLARDINELLR